MFSNHIFRTILFLFIGNFLMNGQVKIDEVTSIINQVKLEHASDGRVAVFDIQVESDNQKIKLHGETNLEAAKNQLISSLNQKGMKFVDEIKLLPASELGEKVFGVVTLSVVNLRKEPKHPAEMVTQALLGTPINVLKKAKDGWFFIQTPDNYLGWVDDDAIQIMDKRAFEKWQKSERVIYTSMFGHCFTGIDETGDIVCDLVQGNILQIISENEKSLKIELPDGRSGYIFKSRATKLEAWLSSIDLSAESILTLAHKYMGIPYLWGGTSNKGFDCSGFTKTVFFMHGLVLPRDASQQVHIGEEVDTKNGFENLQPGDLLFFGTKASESNREKVTHVGIYISDLQFIHEGGRVKINSFNPNKENYSIYRTNTFLRAKRILNSVGEKGVVSIMDTRYFNK